MLWGRMGIYGDGFFWIWEQRGGIVKLMHKKSAEFLLGVGVGLGSATAHEEVDRQGYARKGISQVR
eukprot:121490-Rhodomonas_salina.2